MARCRFGFGFGLGAGSSRHRPSSVFTPASIALSAWYDPSELTTMFKDAAATTPVTADGDIVRRINDKSGNGRHLVATADTFSPLYHTDGTLRWIAFDGVDDLMSVAFAQAQAVDRMTAVRFDTWTANRYLLDGTVNDEMILRQQGAATPAIQGYAGAASGDNNNATLGAGHVVLERYNGATSSLQVDATAAVTGNFGANGASGLTMGGRATGPPYCPAKVYGLVLKAGGQLTAPQIASLKTWLGAKAGIVL